MKWTLTIFALVLLCAGMILGAFGHWDVLLVGFFSAVLLLLCANLDQIAEVSASSNGLKARTREVVRKAESAVEELQLLAIQVATISLSLVQRAGRMDGYGRAEAESTKNSTMAVLSRLGISEESANLTLTEWHKRIETDHVVAVLHIISKTNDRTPDLQDKIQSLRKNWPKMQTPKELRDQVRDVGLLSEDVELWIQDYQHYVETRTYRRPEIWDARYSR